MLHSLSSASNRAPTRADLPNEAHFIAHDVVAAQVVGVASSIPLAVEGKDDRIDAPAGCAKQMFLGLHDAVSVGQQILGIFGAPRV